MKKEEAKKELEVLKKREAELTAIIESEEATAEERLLGLIKGCVIDFDFKKYPGSIFLRSQEGRFMFEQDYRNSCLWCSYGNVWRVFEREYYMSYWKIQVLIRDTVEEHFKWNGLTPLCYLTIRSWKVEEHFKWNGLKPHPQQLNDDRWVEEHFKWNGLE